MQLVERIAIKPNNPLYTEFDKLCFLSKNLYNSTLYAVRQHYFATGGYLNYNAVNKIFTDTNQQDYRALPAKVAKMTQMLVDEAYKSFFALLKLKNKGEYDAPIGVPRYLHSIKGRQVVYYTEQALSKPKDGFIKLYGTDIRISALGRDVKFVRLVPVRTKKMITLEIGYEKGLPEPVQSPCLAALDLGINNLAAVISTSAAPIIINGRPLKAINQFYNKELARVKSELSNFEDDRGKPRTKSNKTTRLHVKRENKIMDYMHKASRYVVNHLVSINASTLVVGYNKGWKQDITLSKAVKQTFIQIPLRKFVKLLEYKCALAGIIVILREESYTSKCSFFDNEPVRKHKKYLGKRMHRGLFRTAAGSIVNADINGAANILKKELLKQEAWNERIRLDLVEACSKPLASAINL